MLVNNPWFIGVVGSVLGAIIIEIIFKPVRQLVIPVLSRTGSELASFLSKTRSVPNCILGVFLVGFLASVLLGRVMSYMFSIPLSAVFFIAVLLISLRKPEFHKYTADTFWGVKWIWRWKDAEVADMRALCPKCDGELEVVYEGDGTGSEWPGHFMCYHCQDAYLFHFEVYELGELYARATREVERVVRTKYATALR